MKVEFKIIAAFAIAFLALALVGTATYLNARNLLDRNTLVVHTYQVMSRIDDVFGSLDEIESGAARIFAHRQIGLFAAVPHGPRHRQQRDQRPAQIDLG